MEFGRQVNKIKGTSHFNIRFSSIPVILPARGSGTEEDCEMEEEGAI